MKNYKKKMKKSRQCSLVHLCVLTCFLRTRSVFMYLAYIEMCALDKQLEKYGPGNLLKTTQEGLAALGRLFSLHNLGGVPKMGSVNHGYAPSGAVMLISHPLCIVFLRLIIANQYRIVLSLMCHVLIVFIVINQ